MAYKVTRSSKIIDTLELIGSDGETKAVIDINIDTSRIAGEYRTRMLAITEAQKKVKEAADEGDIQEAVKALGVGIVNAYQLVFGQQVTAELLEFFENDYQEMFLQTFPFLRDVVSPAITEYAKNQRSQILKAHKRKFR